MIPFGVQADRPLLSHEPKLTLVCRLTETAGEGEFPVVTLPVLSNTRLTLKRVVPGILRAYSYRVSQSEERFDTYFTRFEAFLRV
jgi:hypothetical protein